MFEAVGGRSAYTVELVPCLEFVRHMCLCCLISLSALMLFCGTCFELARSGSWVLVKTSAMSGVLPSLLT